jgi:YegS/Rv2252/BmrU family lipid kinase
MSEKPLIIVNPKSAGGSTESRWAQIASDMAAHFGPFELEFTRRPGHGIELARQAAEGGRGFIIACGGDGTINEVANGILRSGKDAELGVLPSGTGGDFRRTLSMPATARECARGLREGVSKKIDVGKVTFHGHDGKTSNRFFLNVSSFGLSAAINERVKQLDLGWLPNNALRGKAKFAYSTLQEALEVDATLVRVKIDDKDERSLNTLNFCVANSRYFGGGMKIAPDAKLNDGYLDLVNIGEMHTSKILLKAYKLYTGSHLDLKEVNHTFARRIEVTPANGKEVKIETDGELPGKLPAVFEVVPEALSVRVPRSKN